MAEDNKDLSRRFLEVMSSGNVEWFDEVISRDYVTHTPSSQRTFTGSRASRRPSPAPSTPF